MEREVLADCLAGELGRAERALGAGIPGELSDEPTALEDARARVDEDPQYRPWSIRAMILPAAATMVGHIRFHSRPNPDYLRPYARAAVEFGYHVFADHRRRGYAHEAAGAVMDWARAAHGIDQFVVTVSPDNVPSLALIARFGFVEVGQHKDPIDGIEHIYLREIGP